LKESGTGRYFTHIAPLAFVILIPEPHPAMAGLQRRASQAESVPSLAADASELAVPFPKAEDEEEYEDEHQFVSHQALSS
jgi:hypothetical protein